MSRRQVYTALGMAALVAFLLGGAVVGGNIAPSHLYLKLVKPLLRLCVAIGAGLLLGMLIENARLGAKLGRVFSPFLRFGHLKDCLLYTSPSPRDGLLSRMPSSA